MKYVVLSFFAALITVTDAWPQSFAFADTPWSATPDEVRARLVSEGFPHKDRHCNNLICRDRFVYEGEHASLVVSAVYTDSSGPLAWITIHPGRLLGDHYETAADIAAEHATIRERLLERYGRPDAQGHISRAGGNQQAWAVWGDDCLTATSECLIHVYYSTLRTETVDRREAVGVLRYWGPNGPAASIRATMLSRINALRYLTESTTWNAWKGGDLFSFPGIDWTHPRSRVREGVGSMGFAPLDLLSSCLTTCTVTYAGYLRSMPITVEVDFSERGRYPLLVRVRQADAIDQFSLRSDVMTLLQAELGAPSAAGTDSKDAYYIWGSECHKEGNACVIVAEEAANNDASITFISSRIGAEERVRLLDDLDALEQFRSAANPF